jgi:ribose/xylose/arabinose/galactoside ABC-type transport system permease subunit
MIKAAASWVPWRSPLGIGTAFGLVQGFLVSYLEIQPFIISLAGMFLCKRA